MTRKEKEQAILAELERLLDGVKWGTARVTARPVRKVQIGVVEVVQKDNDGKLEFFVSVPHLNTSLWIFQGCQEPSLDLAYVLLGLETRALEEEVKRLRFGIRKVASLTNYPEIALQYLDPPPP